LYLKVFLSYLLRFIYNEIMDDYQSINAKIINNWVKSGWEWSIPIDHETFLNALNGKWSVLLTPNIPVPKKWFGEIKDKQFLGLASGGGQQMPIFTALGAYCTSFDISQEQLNHDLFVATREGITINTVCGDMTQPLPFPDDHFDLIFHPVSNCYVDDVIPIWKECYRVLKKGGVLLAGFDNGIPYVLNDEDGSLLAPLPYNPLKNQDYFKEAVNEDFGIQFSHTIEEQIGGQLQAGFTLTDIYQDTSYDDIFAKYNIPIFYATRCAKY